MAKIEIDDPTTIEATLVHETEKAYLLDCEGDEHWFPKSKVNFNESEKELELPTWLFNKTFPDEV